MWEGRNRPSHFFVVRVQAETRIIPGDFHVGAIPDPFPLFCSKVMSWTRRTFVKSSALALGASMFPFPRDVFGSIRNFIPIRRNVGTFEGRGGTIGWLISDDALIVIDSQFPETAQACLEGIQERSGRRIDYLINSHHHGDHTAGNPIFGPHADNIVAHRRVPELQKRSAEQRGTEDDQVYATTLFDETWSVDVGDESISMAYYGNAHTSGDSVIHFQKADVAHMGDLVFNRRTMFLDLGAGGTSEGWIDVLENIYSDFSEETIFIYGHANPAYDVTGTRDDLLAMRDFLTGLREHVESGIAEGKTVDDLLVNQLPMFEMYNSAEETSGLHRNIRIIHTELTEGS